MARFRRNADFPKLQIDIVHKVDNARLYCAEVVVFKLLVLLRRRAEERSARLHNVGTLNVELAVYEKIFLFRAERYAWAFVGFYAEYFHKALDLRAQNLNRAQKRRFFVEYFARVGAEHRRNAEGGHAAYALDERGAGGVPSRISAGFKGGA